MIVQGERPWDGVFHVPSQGMSLRGTDVDWVEVEPLWDGTPRWEMRVRPTPSLISWLLSKMPLSSMLSEKINWMEDA